MRNVRWEKLAKEHKRRVEALLEEKEAAATEGVGVVMRCQASNKRWHTLHVARPL